MLATSSQSGWVILFAGWYYIFWKFETDTGIGQCAVNHRKRNQITSLKVSPPLEAGDGDLPAG